MEGHIEGDVEAHVGAHVECRVATVRDLGVLLDEKLSFKAQVDSVVSRASMTLGFVKRQAKEFDCPYVTKSLFFSLVRSTLDNASVIWML